MGFPGWFPSSPARAHALVLTLPFGIFLHPAFSVGSQETKTRNVLVEAAQVTERKHSGVRRERNRTGRALGRISRPPHPIPIPHPDPSTQFSPRLLGITAVQTSYREARPPRCRNGCLHLKASSRKPKTLLFLPPSSRFHSHGRKRGPGYVNDFTRINLRAAPTPPLTAQQQHLAAKTGNYMFTPDARSPEPSGPGGTGQEAPVQEVPSDKTVAVSHDRKLRVAVKKSVQQ